MVNGRDSATARFVEARTQEAFQNQTASEIATLLAARRGLRADVDPTEGPVQRYWGGDYSMQLLAQFSRVTNEWEMLVSSRGMRASTSGLRGEPSTLKWPCAV